MTHGPTNLFTSLLRYCGEQKEHFVGEAFVLVLNSLLSSDRKIAVEILGDLCGTDTFGWHESDDIVIRAQGYAGDAGTPDITIGSRDKKVYVEVKVEAPVDGEQLHKYRRSLESFGVRQRQLVLLTKLPAELPPGLEKDVKKVYWHEVRQWLSKREAAVTDRISRYLLNSFAAFLTEGGISMERVDGDYRMLKYALPSCAIL
ncbi:MAG: PD-(D/E)XK nuclease family protein [Chloroflexi bacterium]|nr:PD-(D/E)XK nuclease family protein [Chloroflexota bacterium]